MQKIGYLVPLTALLLGGCAGTTNGSAAADSRIRPSARAASGASGSFPIDQLKAAAERGEPAAQARLGEAYHDGIGITRDEGKAYLWSRRSANQGDATGQLQTGFCFALGSGVARDLAEAARWIRKSAEQGQPVAQLNLGMAYSTGQGVTADQGQAVEWYKKAASQGIPEAQSNLGYAYSNGEGVEQNLIEAARWYRLAAEQGFAEAQSSLAAAYYFGKGVPADAAEGVRWARLAADQGEPRAQSNLGLSYVRGEGISQDVIEAIKWFDLAEAQGYAKASTNRAEAVAVFGVTPAGLAEASRRAAEFIPKPAVATAGHSARVLPRSVGSGFFVTADGYFLTCYHVVSRARSFQLKTRQGVFPATLVRADPANDLALLKAPVTVRPLPLSTGRATGLGDPVFTIGFPNPDWQGLEPKLTKGEISSLAGMRDDPRQFQISVATQPGNSGGPLIDEHGNVVGILIAQANDTAFLRATGALPQSVNYALKSAYAAALVETMPGLAARLPAPSAKPRSFHQIVERAEAGIAMILAYE